MVVCYQFCNVPKWKNRILYWKLGTTVGIFLTIESYHSIILMIHIVLDNCVYVCVRFMTEHSPLFWRTKFLTPQKCMYHFLYFQRQIYILLHHRFFFVGEPLFKMEKEQIPNCNILRDLKQSHNIGKQDFPKAHTSCITTWQTCENLGSIGHRSREKKTGKPTLVFSPFAMSWHVFNINLLFSISRIDNCFNVFTKSKAFHGIIFQGKSFTITFCKPCKVICKSVNF